MPVPIGIGFGDLVALIKILKAAGSSLKASGGAVDDYQHVVKQLEARAAVLQSIANEKSLAGNTTYTNAVKAQAQSVSLNIENLIAEIQPYEEALGTGSSLRAKDSLFKKPIQKVKWATRGSKQVEHKQRKIDASMATEQLLFDLNTSTALSSIDSKGSKTLAIANNQHNLLVQVQSIVNTLNARTSDLENQLTSQYNLQLDQSGKISSAEANSSQAVQLLENNHNLLVEATSISRTLNSTVTSMERLFSMQHRQLISKLQDMDERTSIVPLRMNAEDPLAMISSGTQQIALGMCKLLVVFVAYWMDLMAQFLHALPKLVTHLRIIHAIPMAMSHMLSDNMTLVDVLGTRHDLPFRDFRNWTTFRKMLETRFSDRPGCDRVLSGAFKILTRDDSVLDESNWAEMIEPRMRLVMSIKINLFRGDVLGDRCPRRDCRGTLRSSGGSKLTCSQCELQWFGGDVHGAKRQILPRIKWIDAWMDAQEAESQYLYKYLESWRAPLMILVPRIMNLIVSPECKKEMQMYSEAWRMFLSDLFSYEPSERPDEMFLHITDFTREVQQALIERESYILPLFRRVHAPPTAFDINICSPKFGYTEGDFYSID